MTKKEMIGQGHGIEGRFGGLPNQYANEKEAKIILIPVPFDRTTTYGKGSDLGPNAIIEASRHLELYDIETDSEVYQQGIYTAPAINKSESHSMLDALYHQSKHALLAGQFVVTLGGEHSVSYGAIKAHAEHYQKISVLQLDAHADLQPAYEGNPWSHASAMARIKELPQVEKIVSVGIRSMSHDELPYLDRANTFFAHALDNGEKWINQVIQSLSSPVYITFDLDAFDCSLMPSTGTPEPGGLNWNQAMRLLKRLFESHSVIGFDVVELAPVQGAHAPDYLAAKLVYKLLSYKFYGV